MKDIDVIAEYIVGAELHGLGTQTGDYKKANLGYARLNAAYRILIEKNPELSDLVPLLQHDNISVRSWAATHLLLTKSGIALPVLEEISKHKGLIAFSAEMTIKQWKKGELRF